MAYQPIRPEDFESPTDYERHRREGIAGIIALKERRRVEVGPWVSLAFENRRTVLHQIQEMIRIERITDPKAVLHEIEAFEELMPRDNELSATMFIEITDEAQRRAALSTLGGIEKTITLKIGQAEVPAFDKRPIDPSIERPGEATAVYYLGFRLTPKHCADFKDGSGEVWLQVSHPKYKHAAALSAQQRQELSGD